MAAVWFCWCCLGPVLNEVCYDPPGADGGAEFVELWQAGADTVDLAGVGLEFANGATVPVAWERRWTAPPGTRLEPGRPFLIVASGWEGPGADAEADLRLQNGPDALRLLTPAGELLDLVGWGEVPSSDLAEGRPAADVAGSALARRPDGFDSNDNATDWREAEPSPGLPNWCDFAPRVAALSWEPPSSQRVGHAVVGEFQVANVGLATLDGAMIELSRGSQRWTGTLPTIPPDGVVSVTMDLGPADMGLVPVLVSVSQPPYPAFSDTLGSYQVGLPEVRLAEVMAAPVVGGEWCELMNAGQRPLSLVDLTLRDQDGAWRSLPDVVLEPGSVQLIAQDPDRLLDWLADLAATGDGPRCQIAPPLASGSWPSLNNTAPSSRHFADRLYLGDREGRVLDHVTLGATDGTAPAGRSLERGGDDAWRPATSGAGGTPGCAVTVVPLPAGRDLALAPNPFAPGAEPGAVSLAFAVPAHLVGWTLRIYDLWGQRVRDLGGDMLGPGRRERVWDGRDDAGRTVPPGGYVVCLQWRTSGGGVAPAARRLVVVQ